MIAFLLALMAAACGDSVPEREFDGAQAFEYVRTQMSFGPRIPGTPGHVAIQVWLDSTLRARADTVLVQEWDHVTAAGDTLALKNFIARFNPAVERRVLYLAHYDTRPYADGANSRDSTLAVPGANDGASGVSILLGVADALKARPTELGVDLLFVDGEDYGVFDEKVDVLIGSKYYASHLPAGPKPRFAILWDMVGDKDLEIHAESYSVIAAPEVVQRVTNASRALGYDQYFFADPKWAIEDDHLPLQEVGISAIDVLDFDYPYWHTKDDTIDKVSGESLKVVGDVAMYIIRKAATQD